MRFCVYVSSGLVLKFCMQSVIQSTNQINVSFYREFYYTKGYPRDGTRVTGNFERCKERVPLKGHATPDILQTWPTRYACVLRRIFLPSRLNIEAQNKTETTNTIFWYCKTTNASIQYILEKLFVAKRSIDTRWGVFISRPISNQGMKTFFNKTTTLLFDSIRKTKSGETLHQGPCYEFQWAFCNPILVTAVNGEWVRARAA